MRRIWLYIQKKMGRSYVPVTLLLFSSILFLILYSSVKPVSLNIELFEVSEETIRAHATVEDEEKTEENRRIAAETIQPVYVYNASLDEVQASKIELLFALLREVNEEAEAQYQAALQEAEAQSAIRENVSLSEGDENGSLSSDSVKRLSADEKALFLKEKMTRLDDATKEFINQIPDWTMLALLNASASSMDDIETASIELLTEAMSSPIKEEDLKTVKETVRDGLNYTGLSQNNQRIADILLNQSVIENNLFNDQATAQQKEEAMEKVQPAMILQGQVIVQEGHILDSTAMRQLDLLGLLEEEPSFSNLYGLLLLLAAQAIAVYYLSITRTENKMERAQQVTFYSLAVTAAVGGMKGIQLIEKAGIEDISLLYPAALVPVLLTTFVSRRFGVIANGFLAGFSVFVFTQNTGTSFSEVLVLFYLLSGMTGTMAAHTRMSEQYSSTFVWITLFNALYISFLILYLNQPLLSISSLMMIGFALTSGLLSYVLAITLSPYVEVLYKDNAVLTLTELSNPNNPLLKLLLTNAPGTYHHSLMVANLSANAVSAIGGDALFARVACYYHDIGKMRHPLFFVENLPSGMENPHQMLTPQESKDVIFSHVSEGIKILEEAKLPQSFIDICAQHHGTTLMKYFYAKAKEEGPVNEKDFRYPGPKPQTKEAAVVNIADSAEAAVRAMPNPTKESIEKLVHQLIHERIQDGQMDECDISISELNMVKQSICEGLNGTFHSRIEYPKFNANEENVVALE